MALLTNKNVTKEVGPKVDGFAGFCHHHLATTCAHTYMYHYPLFESGMKTGL